MRRIILGAMLAMMAATAAEASTAKLVYTFTGTLTQAPLDTLEPGTPFSGAWTLRSDQVGSDYAEPFGPMSKLYTLESFRVEMASVVLEVQAVDGLFVYSDVISPADGFASGYFTAYQVSSRVLPLEVSAWNTSIFRFVVGFFFDGQNALDTTALPTQMNLNSDPVQNFLLIDSSGTGIGSGVRFYGAIESVVVTTVPIPPLGAMVGVILIALTQVTRRRGTTRYA